MIKGEGLLTDIIGKEPLKARGDFTVIGKPVQRVDIPAKVRGEFKFVHDVTVDGMSLSWSGRFCTAARF